MVISFKSLLKLSCIFIVACCAAFVCTLFLSYNADLEAIAENITSGEALVLLGAQRSMGKVTVAVTGGCLGATSAVMLLFYVKNYIDAHSRELGILKALGYSDISVARKFAIFGLSMFLGCAAGYAAGFLYLPRFYAVQNADGMFPEMSPAFHPEIFFALVIAPSAVFSVLAVLFALIRLRAPALDLMYCRRNIKVKQRAYNEKLSFLKALKRDTLKAHKLLAFFVAFSAFCFSAMVQMSFSMNELASNTFAAMILSIGLILAYTSLLMSLSSAVKSNAETIALMHALGYSSAQCRRAVLGAYRPLAYIGFAIGTAYQYGLLKLVVTMIFSDVADMPEYNFSLRALLVALAAFIVSYEAIMFLYSFRLKKLTLKRVFDR